MKKGFTLAELLVTICLWVIIAVLLVPTLIKQSKNPSGIKIMKMQEQVDYDLTR